MQGTIQEVLELLDLEQIEVNIFRGISPKDRWQRVFGGQVLGQALVAASRTVEGRICHSLHAYFIRPGDPKVPILYEVDRSRDGKSFTTRRVVAITEIAGTESGRIQLQDLFRFRATGTDRNGVVTGVFHTCGNEPRFTEALPPESRPAPLCQEPLCQELPC